MMFPQNFSLDSSLKCICFIQFSQALGHYSVAKFVKKSDKSRDKRMLCSRILSLFNVDEILTCSKILKFVTV